VALTKLQRKSLETYMAFRDRPPAIGAIFRRSAGRVSFIAAYCVVFGVVLDWLDSPLGAGLMFGILIGLLVGALSQARVFLRVWPAITQVLDWTKLQALLAER